MGKSLTNLNVEPILFQYGIMYFSAVYSTFSAGAYPKADKEDDDTQVTENSDFYG